MQIFLLVILKCAFQILNDYLRIGIGFPDYLFKHICKVVRYIVIMVILDCQGGFYSITDITDCQILYHNFLNFEIIGKFIKSTKAESVLQLVD